MLKSDYGRKWFTERKVFFYDAKAELNSGLPCPSVIPSGNGQRGHGAEAFRTDYLYRHSGADILRNSFVPEE